MTTPSPCIPTVSLASAAALSGLSVRTWQRRIEDGQVARLTDAAGRPHIALSILRSTATLIRHWDERDIAVLLRADQGDALAQAETGACFALMALQLQLQLQLQSQQIASDTPPLAQAPSSRTYPHGNGQPSAQDAARIALFFLSKAADQGDTDAMHWIGLLHANALGASAASSYEVQALMWLSKAAAQGHAIACQQMQAMLMTLKDGIASNLPPTC